MVTVPQAAKQLGKNPETIRRWIRKGRLRSQRVGTQHLIDESDLSALGDTKMLPLPPAWQKSMSLDSEPNWVGLVRRDRDSR